MEKYLNERCIVSEDDVFYYNSDDDITRADVMRFILENETLSSKYASYGRYYKAKHDKIMNAPKKPNNKPDNRLILNYPKKLVDTYTGFAVGKPVQITLQEDMANKALSEFNQTRNIDTLLAKVWKESAIYGRAYFYVYGANKEIYVTDATPMDCFIIYLKLESTQKDRSRYQLWLFFTKISFKQLHEERFEYFQVSNS